MNRVVTLIVVCFTYALADPAVYYRVVTVEKRSDVNRDLQEFINLLPVDKMILLVRDYIKNDNEVQHTVDYFHSRFVQDQIMKIVGSPEYAKVLHHLESSGLDVSIFLVQFHHLLSRIPPPAPVNRVGPGLKGLLIGSIKPLIPMSQLKLLATQKYIFSSEFRGFVRILTSKEFKHDIQALVTSNNVKELEEDARNERVDVKAIYEFVASFQFLYEYLMNL